MNTPGVPKRLQARIRRHFSSSDWRELAETLDITLKSVRHMLDPKSPRELTFHFCGLLAVRLPDEWGAIQVEANNGQ